MRATIAAFSVLLLVSTAGASAAPSAARSATGEATASPIRLAQRDHRDGNGRWQREQRRYDHRGYGRRHGPPDGWHRYRFRPHDYHRRGCTQIGPAWFCP